MFTADYIYIYIHAVGTCTRIVWGDGGEGNGTPCRRGLYMGTKSIKRSRARVRRGTCYYAIGF